MKNKYLLLSLIFLFLYTLLALPIIKPAFAAEIVGKTLRIVLDQTNMASPAVLSVTVDINNPERYMVTYPDSYLTVKELDASGNVLYEGQVPRLKFDPPNMSILVADNPLFINFPYFEEAKRIEMYNDSNKKILDFDLGTYSILPTPSAAPRSIECNACGYCKDKKAPGNLDACMACLYPNLTIEQTLEINPPSYVAPSPKTGAYYSQLGCIDVGIAGFTDSTASGGVLNILLNRFLFPITGSLALISLIYGSFLLITAQGNVEQISRGRRWIYGAIVGVIFTFGSILLIRIIGGDILRIPGFGG
ncbi:hypothetical protein KAZ66_01210 [Candidatus Woesebacteria bacterium]|nr:hypothetical protein [Candidatus Woesebacteria bacterium]